MRRAQPPPLAAADTLAQAFRLAVWEGLDHLDAHLDGARRGEAEAIHQARVALRRLRSGLKLFRRRLDLASRDGFNAALRDLGRILGGARDWDVFVLETVPLVSRAAPGQAGSLDELAAAADPLRTQAHARLRETLASPRTALLLEDLRGWAAEAQAFAGGAGVPIGREAPRLLDRLARTAGRRGRDMAGQTDEQRHTLRKALKSLRYGMQILEGLHEGEPARPYRRALGALQEDLGLLNDAIAAAELAGRLPCPSGIAVISAWSAGQRDAALSALPAAWQAFVSLEPYW